MARLHHPHLFSEEWFELHSVLLTELKRYGASLLMGALAVTATVLVIQLEQEMDIPLQMTLAVGPGPVE